MGFLFDLCLKKPLVDSDAHAEYFVTSLKRSSSDVLSSRNETARKRGARASTRRSQLAREEGMPRRSRPCYAVANPSEVAKAVGTPNNLIVTCPEASGCALRARRSCHERRECARCAREKITSVMGGEAAGGDRLISRRWDRTSWRQARLCSLRLQSRQSNGAEPTCSGWRSILTWRGFAVALPCHWHCSRRGQGRQL